MRFPWPIFITGCLFAFESICVGRGRVCAAFCTSVSVSKGVRVQLKYTLWAAIMSSGCQLAYRSLCITVRAQSSERSSRPVHVPAYLVPLPAFFVCGIMNSSKPLTSLSFYNPLLWQRNTNLPRAFKALSGSFGVSSLFIGLENCLELSPKALKTAHNPSPRWCSPCHQDEKLNLCVLTCLLSESFSLYTTDTVGPRNDGIHSPISASWSGFSPVNLWLFGSLILHSQSHKVLT